MHQDGAIYCGQSVTASNNVKVIKQDPFELEQKCGSSFEFIDPRTWFWIFLPSLPLSRLIVATHSHTCSQFSPQSDSVYINRLHLFPARLSCVLHTVCISLGTFSYLFISPVTCRCVHLFVIARFVKMRLEHSNVSPASLNGNVA